MACGIKPPRQTDDLGARPGPRPQLARWALPDKYQALRVLGSGGMGTVLLARDRNLGRLLAVKLLHTECPDFLARLRREARLLARLDHPAIVRVHDLDTFQGRNYLAMEYLAGGNLAQARLPREELVIAARQVADALSHSHAQGIVHRDVKPENVMLRSRGPDGATHAVLTDFGLAAPHRPGSHGGDDLLTGTPLTMSPEQTLGEAIGPASDVFSLGVTLYRKLTGSWPFCGRSVGDVIEAIRGRDPLPPRRLDRSISPRLETAVLRALAKDPARRFSSMDEFGAALDRSRQGSFFRPRRNSPPASPSAPRLHPEDLS